MDARGGTTIGGYTALHSGLANAVIYGTFTANQVFCGVYNDLMETRPSRYGIIPGYVAFEQGDGFIEKNNKRLQKGAMLTSDTYGMGMGRRDGGPGVAMVPVAIAGRALAYTDKDRGTFEVGDAVCAGAHGTVSRMRWWERILYPDRIIGVVSEIPDYEVWIGEKEVRVDGRIWVRVR